MESCSVDLNSKQTTFTAAQAICQNRTTGYSGSKNDVEYCLEVSREIRASLSVQAETTQSVPKLNVSRGLCLICVYSPSLICFPSLHPHTHPHTPPIFSSLHPHLTPLPPKERERGRQTDRQTDRQTERAYTVSVTDQFDTYLNVMSLILFT